MESLSFMYCLTFEDQTSETFTLRFDPVTFDLLDQLPEPLPSWAELTFHQCPHCPLDAQSSRYCPVAAHLTPIVTRFSHILPYKKAHLTVIAQERVISQDTTIQAAAASCMGLVMAGSGCPYTAYFKPMARFHVPVATPEETMYRSVSMYLMAEYFRNKDGQAVTCDLAGLTQIYEDIHTVNTTLAQRFLAASKRDSSIDAVVQLDIYAMTFLGILDEPLEELRPLFAAFFHSRG